MLAITDTLSQAATEVKELYLVEKAHFQAFLDYLATKPYAEVVGFIEKMKTAQLCNVTYPAAAQAAAPTDSTPAPVLDPTPEAPTAPVADTTTPAADPTPAS
jgi:hypothetical protein